MRAIDAALSQHDSVHVEAARVVPDVLVRRALAAPIGAVEIDRLALFTGDVVVLELSVDLVRRCEHKRHLGIVLARCLQEVQRAPRVDVEVRGRVGE